MIRSWLADGSKYNMPDDGGIFYDRAIHMLVYDNIQVANTSQTGKTWGKVF